MFSSPRIAHSPAAPSVSEKTSAEPAYAEPASAKPTSADPDAEPAARGRSPSLVRGRERCAQPRAHARAKAFT
eukprot:CAMPEP_0179852758 /NCGR_PEP_ID=MMETSP0982-20121206/8978_1 /TAXON_ID=483367 /ORGANISM="non described non described, Strain CCMP 2436" /LENGTH=72 /DNA_ID=CAMNT_0021738413 /DNA_START=315 /DNA_END=529 /DNA_ORIENTATION=-